jgi:hypothetical protein
MPWGGGGQFQPPAVVNDAESPVCNDSENELADVNPHLFFYNSNPECTYHDAANYSSRFEVARPNVHRPNCVRLAGGQYVDGHSKRQVH